MNDQKKFKSLCVTQRNGKYYYPKTIPKERGPLATHLSICLIFLLFLADICTNEKNVLEVTYLYACGILFSMFLQVIRRIILMCEEYKHLISRYEGSFLNLLKDALYFHGPVCIAFLICLTYCCLHRLPTDINLFRLIVFLIPSVYFTGIVLKLDNCHLRHSLWVAEDNGLDYGSGMAYSFFHGYLNIVLPKTGNEEKNLKELMQDYEDKNNINFNVYKLFILIPKSMTCFISLKNEYSPSIDESSSLPEKIITVAGVKDRVYKNAVYKIVSDKNKKIYVSAEYATPLKTFKDVFDKTGPHSDFYNKHKKEIILQFYLTLKKVLEGTGMNEFCELIYFEDSYEEDGTTRYYDVGRIIQTRLKKFREKTE
ncbi:hypothetical protein JTB14_002051 [Gonioctena quinquepunctata]|nr:hypothetical protein JTB14_002051 [Gonioctena quinquepunctata]